MGNGSVRTCVRGSRLSDKLQVSWYVTEAKDYEPRIETQTEVEDESQVRTRSSVDQTKDEGWRVKSESETEYKGHRPQHASVGTLRGGRNKCSITSYKGCVEKKGKP